MLLYCAGGAGSGDLAVGHGAPGGAATCRVSIPHRLFPGGAAGHALQVGGNLASRWKVPERRALQGGRS